MNSLRPAPTDPDELRRRAQTDGYLYLPRLLRPEQLEDLRRVINDALARRGWSNDPALRLGRWDDPRWVAFLAEVLPTPAYRAVAAAPELLAVLRLVLGAEPQLSAGDVCRLVSPGAPELTTPPHQDAAYLSHRDIWTAWLPIDACPLEMGPLAVLPGSHLEELRPHAPVERGGKNVVGADVPDDAPWHASSLELGDVILFSALTLHCALPNVSDRLRVSVDYRYRPR